MVAHCRCNRKCSQRPESTAAAVDSGDDVARHWIGTRRCGAKSADMAAQARDQRVRRCAGGRRSCPTCVHLRPLQGCRGSSVLLSASNPLVHPIARRPLDVGPAGVLLPARRVHRGLRGRPGAARRAAPSTPSARCPECWTASRAAAPTRPGRCPQGAIRPSSKRTSPSTRWPAPGRCRHGSEWQPQPAAAHR